MPDNLTDYEENRLLDLSALNTDKLALMRLLGSDSGAGTEVAAGTAYARQTLSFAAAAAGAKVSNGVLSFTGLPATEVQGWAIYDSAGTNRKWHGLWNKTVASVAASTDLFTATNHGRLDNAKVVFLPGFTPNGLLAATTYFVRDSTANTFRVAATAGGTALDIGADMAGAVLGTVTDVASGGVWTVASGDITLRLS